jgi:hypothetical protein
MTLSDHASKRRAGMTMKDGIATGGGAKAA